MNRFKIIILLIILTKCGSSNLSSSNCINVLFIGNSLSYTNNLPELVEKAAKQKNVCVKTTIIAHSNYAIMDHWNDGEVQKEISDNHYDFVIIQQGPSSQAFGRKILIEYGEKYSDLCKAQQSKLCYYMVWPSRTYYHTFSDVIKNYRDASLINDVILCPVGAVWKTHFDSTNRFDYYSPDGFHPSLKGSQIAAEVIVDKLIIN